MYSINLLEALTEYEDTVKKMDIEAVYGCLTNLITHLKQLCSEEQALRVTPQELFDLVDAYCAENSPGDVYYFYGTLLRGAVTYSNGLLPQDSVILKFIDSALEAVPDGRDELSPKTWKERVHSAIGRIPL